MRTLPTDRGLTAVPRPRSESGPCPVAPTAPRCPDCGRAGATRTDHHGVAAWYELSRHTHDVADRCAASEWTLHTEDRCSALRTWDVEV